MRHLTKLSLIALLVIGLVLTVAHPIRAVDPAVNLPISPLNVPQLQATLDRKDVAGAIRLVESGWSYQYEQYYGGKLTSQILSAEKIRERLETISKSTGRRSALIYIIPTDDQLELILVPPGASPIHRRITAVNRQTLLQFVQSFRNGVMDPQTKRSDYLESAQRLYRVLISPLEVDLRDLKINTLIFCLGGGLRTVPLAALHDGKRFLVEKFNLAVIPAFNLLDPVPTKLNGTKVLAMGASKFEELSPLPAVPLELTAIAKNQWQGEILLNQNFTLANLQAYRAKSPFGIVHLATHANFSPGSISDSFIQFWQERLPLNRVRDLGLRSPPAQLLVLSACSTAVGNPQAELGFAGLAVLSGSKAAIASLWQVSDLGTLILMTEFYRQLKTTMKPDALRRTQIALLSKRVSLKNNPLLGGNRSLTLPPELKDRQDDLSHPYYWAAFTLVGTAW
ncbi:MAG TPA: CHAT domain-containing protein [Crinalium sp.]